MLSGNCISIVLYFIVLYGIVLFFIEVIPELSRRCAYLQHVNPTIYKLIAPINHGFNIRLSVKCTRSKIHSDACIAHFEFSYQRNFGINAIHAFHNQECMNVDECDINETFV